MTKKEVIGYFGSVKKTCEALRISKMAVSKWPEVLTERISFRVELATNGDLKTDETKRKENDL